MFLDQQSIGGKCSFIELKYKTLIRKKQIKLVSERNSKVTATRKKRVRDYDVGFGTILPDLP